MRKPCVLVVAEDAAATTQLPRLGPALADGGFDVRTATEDEVLTSAEPDGPDGLLVSASLGLQRVALLARRFAHLPAPPTTIVFPQDDLDALEACVRGGFDYIMPPFLPSLLRSDDVSFLDGLDWPDAMGGFSSDDDMPLFDNRAQYPMVWRNEDGREAVFKGWQN